MSRPLADISACYLFHLQDTCQYFPEAQRKTEREEELMCCGRTTTALWLAVAYTKFTLNKANYAAAAANYSITTTANM